MCIHGVSFATSIAFMQVKEIYWVLHRLLNDRVIPVLRPAKNSLITEQNQAISGGRTFKELDPARPIKWKDLQGTPNLLEAVGTKGG